MTTTDPLTILRRAFTALTAEQKANVRKHLDAGVRVLCGEDYLWFTRAGGA